MEKKVRTLNKNDTWNETSNRYDYPQTPSRIQFSLWPVVILQMLKVLLNGLVD